MASQRSGTERGDGANALADLLILDGQVERGRRLLAEIIGTMEREIREGRPEFWFLRGHAMALALNGETDAAIATLERSYASGRATSEWWCHLEAEPAYDALRKIPRFEALRGKVREHIAEQRREARAHAQGRPACRSVMATSREVAVQSCEPNWNRREVGVTPSRFRLRRTPERFAAPCRQRHGGQSSRKLRSCSLRLG